MTICVHPKVGDLCVDWCSRSGGLIWWRGQQGGMVWACGIWRFGVGWIPLGHYKESLWTRIREALS